VQLPAGTQRLGDRIKRRTNNLPGQVKALKLPLNSSQKRARREISVLIGMDDVATVGINKVGKLGNQARLVRTSSVAVESIGQRE
jgi:hypothetical protein